MTTVTMPSAESVRVFLRQHYKHDRFEGRDGPVYGADYSGLVVQSTLEMLERYGEACVSKFESRTGDAVWFRADLVPHATSRRTA